jgi:hypothetical protein
MRVKAQREQSSEAIQLAEVSQAIHRTLIALKADSLQVCPDAFAVEW